MIIVRSSGPNAVHRFAAPRVWHDLDPKGIMTSQDWSLIPKAEYYGINNPRLTRFYAAGQEELNRPWIIHGRVEQATLNA